MTNNLLDKEACSDLFSRGLKELGELNAQMEKREIILRTGEPAWREYDREGDLLEIIFRHASATCAAELTESIILRFDWAASEPLSLSFISFSRLLQPNKYGALHFQLLTEEWPDEVKDKVWTMLQKPPLTDFLIVSSYSPAHTDQLIPTATIRPLPLETQAA